MNQAQFERIESYLQSTLSEAEHYSFEADLEADEALKTALEAQQRLRLGLQALAIEKQLTHARERAKIRTKTPDVQKLDSSRIWSIAASIVLLLGVGWWAWQLENAPESNSLADRAEQEMTDVQYKSMPLDSLQKLTKTADLRQAREKAEWYVALAYLKKGKKQAAKEVLTRIADDPRHAYSQKARELMDESVR